MPQHQQLHQNSHQCPWPWQLLHLPESLGGLREVQEVLYSWKLGKHNLQTLTNSRWEYNVTLG